MSRQVISPIRALAALLEYPEAGYQERVADCRQALDQESGEATVLFSKFCESVHGLETEELQEMFTRSFDLDPACNLEIGWHLFGEDYRRGEFLVKMRQQLRARQISESSELPDHLTHALALLDTMEPAEAADFAGDILLPALDRMRGAGRKDAGPFGALVEVAFTLLRERFDYQPQPIPFTVPELRILP